MMYFIKKIYQEAILWSLKNIPSPSFEVFIIEIGCSSNIDVCYCMQWELPRPAPPGTFPSYAAIEQYTTVRAFWIFNSMSFFFSMASVIASAEGILPVQGKFIKEAVQDARKAVVYASLLLVVSVVFALGSFASCGFAVLPPIERWEKYMVATISFGGLTTIVFTARFVLPISKMLKHQQNPLNQVPRGKFQKLEW